MKILLFLSILLIGASSAKAQEGCAVSNPGDSSKYIAQGVWNLPVEVMKDAAKQTYFDLLDAIHDTSSAPFNKAHFDSVLNRYDYWRKLVSAKLTDKKAQTDFYNWIIAEARAAGKLTYDSAKKG